ncbi:MAG: DUF1579 family protein [Mucilaginibacter sp.]
MKKLLLIVLTLIGPAYLFAQSTPGNFISPVEVYVKPNEVHQFLAQYSGEWDEVITIWLFPKSQGENFKVSSTNKMILNGRFLQSSQSGYLAGSNFEGLTTLGYSTTNQRFTVTILDNLGTGTITLMGYWVTPLKTIELFGDMPTPENTDVIHIRQVITFIDKDNYVVQNFDKRAGQEEYKNFEYRFTRKSTVKVN